VEFEVVIEFEKPLVKRKMRVMTDLESRQSELRQSSRITGRKSKIVTDEEAARLEDLQLRRTLVRGVPASDAIGRR
jgi:hypothetical protein